MMDFSARLQQVTQQIRDAETSAQREQNSVQLLAVSKTKPKEAVEAFYDLGVRSFGENYVQEGVEKIAALSHLDIEWHFIGPLQSNKSKLVAENFHWMHTMDRLKIAQRLNEQRLEGMPPLNVLIQVNISLEDSKSGIALNEVPALAAEISKLPHLALRGLMCIPAQSDEDKLKFEFDAMHLAFTKLKSQYPSVDTLSMGMTNDLALAVACGSTMVRIGTALFGARDYPTELS